ncbi:MAG TPA: CU044_5270 family protein [Streptosporangiaceae bacterium]|nr:CU044_5270 family protein [Streptosporangiaceae bacterium]
MTLLEDFRAAVAPPGEPTLIQARERMLGGAPGWGRMSPRWAYRLGSRGKLALTGLGGLAAAATAAAVAMALTAPGAGPVHAGVPSPVVREMAYRAAAAAAARPEVAPGQWVYWQEKAFSPPFSARERGRVFQVWTTADGTKAAWLLNGKVASVPCAVPVSEPLQSCQYIGQPIVMTDDRGKDTGIAETSGKIPVTYAGLRSLPRDPVALDRYLAGLPLRGWGPASVREFEVIKDLLITYVMPPALTAELYRALGNIPGVTIDRHATDLAGRHGIGFKIALPAGQGAGFDELILDPRTFVLMGQQATLGQAAGAKAGQVIGGVAILKSALVSGPGVLP